MHIGRCIDEVTVKSISYADNMVLLRPFVVDLRKVLRVCEAFAVEHDLKYNVTKSELHDSRVAKRNGYRTCFTV